jgi:creatinine amidohydrolase
METSLMLSIRPDLVKGELPARDGTHPESEYGDRVSQFLRMDEMTEQGIYGDPTFGSAEKGERMFEAIAGCLADIVGDLQSGKF